MLVASLALQQVKEVGIVTAQEEITTECKIQNYVILALTVNSFWSSNVCSSTLQNIKAVQGMHFSNAVKIIIFISDVQYYVPIKLCKTAGSIHLFKITSTIKPENVNLNPIHFFQNA